ncbi:MAG: YdcF family protein, partial [Deltaproteobacteria bacterium]|nr:YdcF family protein [Deltaproteobacteria bacterium]
MSFVKAVLALALLMFCLVAILFVDFAYRTSTMRQREVSTDAIVVL